MLPLHGYVYKTKPEGVPVVYKNIQWDPIVTIIENHENRSKGFPHGVAKNWGIYVWNFCKRYISHCSINSHIWVNELVING